MDTTQGVSRVRPLNTPHATSNEGAVSHRKSPTSATTSPLPSAPATPNPHKAELSRQSVYPSTSPIIPPHSPNPAKSMRRASSAMSLNSTSRPTSSPGLKKKSSRNSLGAPPQKSSEDNNDRRPTPKRSISNLITGLREAHSKMEAIEEPIPLTAPQIAIQHFARELSAHSREAYGSEVEVILHDACYGHRYSRLKTTKTTLSMIVERPERIHASVLGASTAYVRLGGHHAEGRNAPHPDIAEAAPPPFKVRRTSRMVDLNSSAVTNVHGTAWMGELKGMCMVAGERIAAGAKELERAGTGTEPQKRKLHEGDLYLSAQSLHAFQGALGGVADAVDAVFDPASSTNRAFVAVRPPGHHCSADHPSGFCWLNNVHVGIEYAAQTHGLTHAAIVDFDLHHGDGSQAITWQRNSKNNEKRLNAKPNSKLKLAPDIGYYSLHDINSYPCEMGDDEKVQAASLCIDNAHGQSIWNVHLEEWKTVEGFWRLYEEKYKVLLDKARKFLKLHAERLRKENKVVPKAAVFISAGFDASEWEGAGMQRHKVNVPTEFYARLTRDVVELAQEEGSRCEGRVVSVLEGGYSDRALCSGVLSHLSGLCATPRAIKVKEEPTQTNVPLDQMMRGLDINGTSAAPRHLEYDTSWWSAENLTALELKVNPPPPALAKKMRIGQQPTYATPTESFAYKVVDTDKFARSISGTMRDVARPARPPTPPAPEVDWVVATQELSKLLIPTDRQTRSCTPDELAGPKVQRAARVSAAPAATMDDVAKPRQLRDRKAKGPASAHSDEMADGRSVSRSSRRQTIADFALNSDPVGVDAAARQRRGSRRLSAGSTLSSIGGDLDSTAPPVPPVATTGGGRRMSGMMKPPAPPSVGEAGMAVKKTRVPPPPSTTAAAARAKKTVGSASGSPANSRRSLPPVAATAEPPTFGPGTQPSATSAVPSANGGAELDALMSTMKKITLKVGTKEEHDRKQKEKLDAERRARALKGAETRRVNAAAKKEKAAAAAAAAGKEGGVNQVANRVYTAAHAVPQGLWFADSATAPSGISVGEPASTAVQQVPDVSMEAPMLDNQTSAVSFPLQAPALEPPQPSEAMPSQMLPPLPHDEPIQQTPPHPASGLSNVPVPDSAARQLIYENGIANGVSPAPTFGYAGQHVPSYPMTGTQNLPVWSSTGKIPFGTAPVNYGPMNNDSAPSFVRNGFSVDSNNIKKEQGQGSVWDVPETPQR